MMKNSKNTKPETTTTESGSVWLMSPDGNHKYLGVTCEQAGCYGGEHQFGCHAVVLGRLSS